MLTVDAQEVLDEAGKGKKERKKEEMCELKLLDVVNGLLHARWV